MVEHSERRKRRWCLLDLVTDHVTGKLRWQQIAEISAGCTILYEYAHHITPQAFETMTLVVGGIFIGSNGMHRLLNLKAQSAASEVK